jgi:hypothetical protein
MPALVTCGWAIVAGAPEEIRTPDPQIRSFYSDPDRALLTLRQSVTMADYTIVTYCISAVATYRGEHRPRYSLRRSHRSKSMPLARLSLSDRVVATLPLAGSGQQIVRDSDLADAECPTHQAKK